MTNVVWFRRDARLGDNPAWSAAAEQGRIVPLFVIDPKLFDVVSDRRRRLLVHGLYELDRSLVAMGGRLRVEVGNPRKVVPEIVRESGANAVFVNQDVSPYGRKRDKEISLGVPIEQFDGNYVHPVGSILTAAGDPYRVFTAFYRSWGELQVTPFKASIPIVSQEAGAGLPDIGYCHVEAGVEAARTRVKEFIDRVGRYQEERDFPGIDTTSRLSIDLKYGWIGPREVVAAASGVGRGRQAFVRQMAWRDFHANVMWHFPKTASESMRAEFRNLNWVNDPEDLAAWKQGRTGYPLVDAGMRQLASEGWLHNRVRLVAASFLVKDLLVDWRLGERFFRRHLLDGDVPQNVGNWQWVAGTGTDAAPYFRVFNPVTQSRRFDLEGTYIRRWVPELSDLSAEHIHAPWETGPLDLAEKGVVLGVDYPEPIVDHAWARERAIGAYREASG